MTLSQHSAPGVNAAFSYQFERALYWLAKSPAGSVIGLETDDDVAVRGTDASRLLEQDKHSVRDDAKPFGDRSKDLWNTLAIWIEALDTKEVPTDTTIFLMVTNKVLPECIAKQIGRATSEAQTIACVAALEAAAEKPPKKIAPLIEPRFAPRISNQSHAPYLARSISRWFASYSGTRTAQRNHRLPTVARMVLDDCGFYRR